MARIRSSTWIRWLLLVIVLTLSLNATAGTSAQSPALCNDWNFVESADIRAEFGDYRYLANCKLINPRRTGILVPDTDVTMMVNVFALQKDIPFEKGGVICLIGNNELQFTTGPSQPVHVLDVFRVPAWPGYVCAMIYETGYVLRTRNPSNLPAFRPPPPPIVQSQCLVTTNARLRLRFEPDLNSRILTVIPAVMSLPSDQRIQVGSQWWYHVPASPANAEPGWLSGDYLSFEGDCGYVCEQDPAGTRILCGIR
jgi:hypothetical protein